MIIKRYIKPAIILFVTIFTVSNPYLIIQSVKNGLIICYENIIPSLFIFMVISNYASQHDILNVLSPPLNWYSTIMKVKRKDYGGYLLLSIIGGFAVGSKFINQMKKDGYEENALCVLGTAMINNSLAFCVFAVGAGMLKNSFVGWLIYASTVSASLISAFIISFFVKYNIVTVENLQQENNISFARAVYNAVNSILSVCGFVIVFNSACEVISLYIYENKFLCSFLVSFLELTCGCIKIFEFYGKNPVFYCVLLSILPASTLCQVYYFTQNNKLIKVLMLSRLIHTPVSLLIFTLLSNLFPAATYTCAITEAMADSFSYSGELSFTLFIIAFIFIRIVDKNRLFTNSQ